MWQHGLIPDYIPDDDSPNVCIAGEGIPERGACVAANGMQQNITARGRHVTGALEITTFSSSRGNTRSARCGRTHCGAVTGLRRSGHKQW
jgi:hypothetical protein